MRNLAINCLHRLFSVSLLLRIMFLPAIGIGSEDKTSASIDPDNNITNLTGAKRYINNFNYDDGYYKLTPINLLNSTGTKIKTEFDSTVKFEGKMSFKCNFAFSGQGAQAEIIRLERTWNHSYRTDLSFYPLGISIWINSSGTGDKLFINLLQQNDEFNLALGDMFSFTYANETVLSKKGWQQLVIPYDSFKPVNGQTKLNLARINGYQFDIENVSKEAHKGTVYFDAFEQLTSYKPQYEGLPMFSSIFIQLHHPTHDHIEWVSLFNAYREICIDTVIIQRAVSSPKGVTQFFYSGSKLPQKDVEYDMINKVFAAAKSTGMKIVLGLNQGVYPQKKDDAKAYDELYERNREILDELYAMFSENPAMAGWYIAEEFHDGVYRGWWKHGDRMLLANFQQRVAAHAKSKSKKFPVAIAPALWRGRPADMTYEFFRSYFEKTPDIDILYLQDCAGRARFNEDDLDVVLPHWYTHIKRACDETGVQFGVDIEAFKGKTGDEPYYSKPWGCYLQGQLKIASMFTKNITLFSWRDFRPGVGAFDEYREYLKKNGKLNTLN